jgi:hypothetical protein
MELAGGVAQAANKGNKELRRWNRRFKHAKGSEDPKGDLDPAEMGKNAVIEFKIAFGSGFNPVEHAALQFDPKIVFDSYFRRDPPFDKSESKEFPDAFVVATLDCFETLKLIEIFLSIGTGNRTGAQRGIEGRIGREPSHSAYDIGFWSNCSVAGNFASDERSFL